MLAVKVPREIPSTAGGAMPVPLFARVKRKLGIWDPYHLPSTPQYDVLCHLLEPKEATLDGPFLYLEESNLNKPRASLSNTAYSVGRGTRVDSERFIENGWIRRDKEETDRLRGRRRPGVPVIKAYRLSSKGQEAIVQYRVHKKYQALFARELANLLGQTRQQIKKMSISS